MELIVFHSDGSFQRKFAMRATTFVTKCKKTNSFPDSETSSSQSEQRQSGYLHSSGKIAFLEKATFQTFCPVGVLFSPGHER